MREESRRREAMLSHASPPRNRSARRRRRWPQSSKLKKNKNIRVSKRGWETTRNHFFSFKTRMERGRERGNGASLNSDNTSGTEPARNQLPALIGTTANQRGHTMECDHKIKSHHNTFSFRIPGTDIKIIIMMIKEKKRRHGAHSSRLRNGTVGIRGRGRGQRSEAIIV